MSVNKDAENTHWINSNIFKKFVLGKLNKCKCNKIKFFPYNSPV